MLNLSCVFEGGKKDSRAAEELWSEDLKSGGLFQADKTLSQQQGGLRRPRSGVRTEVTWTCAGLTAKLRGMRCRKKALLIMLLVCSIFSISAAKPRLRLAADGFPTGQDTPEGAASDLARAFMTRDALGFRHICIRPYGDGQARAEYTEYLDGVSNNLKREIATPPPDSPQKIVKVFAARHLSKNGPASYGYASFDFQDVMFVDVKVALHNGKQHVRRTMVIKDRDGKWYTHPVPDVSPLLSYGLYDESASVHLFSDVYDVER